MKLRFERGALATARLDFPRGKGWRLSEQTVLRLRPESGGQVALARRESVASLAARWRPDRVASTPPRPHFRAAFRLPERRALIATLGAAR